MAPKATVTPFQDIAIALSGGGFRAAAYSLGCLSYLHRISLAGTPLLSRVKFVSSASGGSIVNLYYAWQMALQPGVSFHSVFAALYDFLDDSKVIAAAFKTLQEDAAWEQRPEKGRNLINAFALAYDKILFQHAELKDLSPSQAMEICVNATEFDHGVSFRFQTGYGKMGNSKITINPSVAGRFRLGDILAASSCFPMGFEPMMMPFDFAHEKLTSKEIQESTTGQIEFGLMDGGITDNQGIYSFLLAEDRKVNREGRGYDLFIYCDVASPYMEGYELPKEKRSFPGSFSIQFFINLIKTTPLFALIGGVILYRGFHPWWMVVLTTLLSILSLGYFTGLSFLIRSKKQARDTKNTWLITFFRYINELLFTRTSAILQMVQARIKSAGILVGDVYLKQIRRLTINSLYENGKSGEKWKVHAVANMIYELSSENMRSDSASKIPEANDLPSPAIRAAADLARDMDTTLWFDEYHVTDGRREALIATGQFTTCYNLLKYLDRLSREQAMTPALDDLRARLTADWKQFNRDPYFIATHSELKNHHNIVP